MHAMETVSVSGLKRNPTEALRKSQDGLVVVMNRGRPEALVVGLSSTGAPELAGVRAALATALFRDGNLSLARAARVAQMPLSGFMAHLSRLGIPVIQTSAAEGERDLETLDRWLAAS
jgi:predicted HTH domain antitoxin